MIPRPSAGARRLPFVLLAVLAIAAAVFASAPISAQGPPPSPRAVGGVFTVAADGPVPGTDNFDANFRPGFVPLHDGGYAAVWTRFLESGDTDVVGRRFGATDEPIGPLFTVNQSDGVHQKAALDGDGASFLVVWTARVADVPQILTRRYDARAEPVGPPRRIDEGMGAGGNLDAAVSGDLAVVVWNPTPPTAEGFRLLGRRIGADGRPIGEPFPIRESTGGGIVGPPAVAADGAGGFVVVWRELQLNQPGGTLHARRLDDTGDPVGVQVVLFDSPDRLPRNPAVAAGPDGGFVVAWNDCPSLGDTGPCGVRMRSFDAQAQPRGGAAVLEPMGPRHSRDPAVVVDTAGNHAVSWPWCRTDDGSQPDCGLDTAFFGAHGERLGTLRPNVERGSIPSQISSAVVDRDVLVGWTGISATPEGAYGQRYRLVGFEPPNLGGGPGAPPPPGVAPLATPELPGFLFWVRIGGDPGAPVQQAPDCVPETLCVSGAIPDRAELFLRIVGPKPNGRLWPNIVKFTTSQVEIWIEQEATGEVNYYLLQGAFPGSSTLPGLFDRGGFLP